MSRSAYMAACLSRSVPGPISLPDFEASPPRPGVLGRLPLAAMSCPRSSSPSTCSRWRPSTQSSQTWSVASPIRMAADKRPAAHCLRPHRSRIHSTTASPGPERAGRSAGAQARLVRHQARHVRGRASDPARAVRHLIQHPRAQGVHASPTLRPPTPSRPPCPAPLAAPQRVAARADMSSRRRASCRCSSPQRPRRSRAARAAWRCAPGVSPPARARAPAGPNGHSALQRPPPPY